MKNHFDLITMKCLNVRGGGGRGRGRDWGGSVAATLSVGVVILNKVLGLFPRDAIDVADFVAKPDSVKLVRILEQLRPERGCDELRRVTKLVYHVRDSFSMHCIQCLGGGSFKLVLFHAYSLHIRTHLIDLVE